jgi:hypothetical protein
MALTMAAITTGKISAEPVLAAKQGNVQNWMQENSEMACAADTAR